MMNIPFRVNLMISILLADFLHIAECALRPRVKDKNDMFDALNKAEDMLYAAFRSKWYLFTIPRALKKIGSMFAQIPVYKAHLPLIYVTGEFFANLTHGEGNYDLRRFIMDDGCEVLPGLFAQRALYDNWRRRQEAIKGITYAKSKSEKKFWSKSLRSQNTSDRFINRFFNIYKKAINPAQFNGRADLMDLDHLAELGREHYHPEIFGGEGNLEIAEAIHYADSCDGFISCKPFGCMPSSGVSDGVQSKIISMYPQLNFLSIETSGDNEVSILGRVSMLLFKAKQKVYRDKKEKVS
jgi:predicted nucleotide-binding protein (sugar kinase/HSP70/actin superfamily)